MVPCKSAVVGCTVAVLAVAPRLLCLPAHPSDKEPQRIVTVGDVHGDLQGLRTILQTAGIVDSQGNWAGGEAVFVQTGDLIDRGPDDRAVLDFMMDLQKQAKQAGGEVIPLLGNHEIMNMMGDWRYVSADSYAAFADQKSEKRRRDLLKKTIRYMKDRARALKLEPPDLSEAWEHKWLESHPLGYVERHDEFAPRGRYGRWLRDQIAIVQLGKYVFLHGGISPQFSELGIDELNKRILTEVKAFDGYRSHMEELGIILETSTLEEFNEAVKAELVHQSAEFDPRRFGGGTDLGASRARYEQYLELLRGVLGYGNWYSMHSLGPLWFRGYSQWDEEEGSQKIAEIARVFGAAAFIVGHTPQLEGGIQTRFGGRVVLIDTGLHDEFYPGGIPAALEISQGRFTAIYTDHRQQLPSPQELASLSSTGN